MTALQCMARSHAIVFVSVMPVCKSTSLTGTAQLHAVHCTAADTPALIHTPYHRFTLP